MNQMDPYHLSEIVYMLSALLGLIALIGAWMLLTGQQIDLFEALL